MAGATYKAPRLYDIPAPDLFTLVAQENPRRDFVQIIQEHTDASIDSIRYTWSQVIQHAQNAAADLRTRWALSVTDENAKAKAAQPREPGSPPVVAGVLASNGYELYVNFLACTLNRWTVRVFGSLALKATLTCSQVLLISPKNSPAAIEHLLATSTSSLLLIEPSNLAFGREMEQALPGLTALTVATLDAPAEPAPSPLTSPTPEQLKKEMELPAFYLHTSGSTGQS
jgi:acyl-CoA synthetase (AMP-forming)/AMP-acid ligase II